jgi:hypothetical protein
VRSKKEKSDRKVEEKTKKDLTGPTLLEITGFPTNREVDRSSCSAEKKNPLILGASQVSRR